VPTFSDFQLTAIDGSPMSLAPYAGKVVLVVNVASQCGFTPQYKGLEKLWRTHRDAGLVILGCPCDQFGHQEPGNEAEIAEFCSLTYDVTFPLSAKLEVNGAGAHPLWQWMQTEKPGLLGTTGIKWNFTKFLIGRDGKVAKRFAPNDTPESIEGAIVRALGTPGGTPIVTPPLGTEAIGE
jgi:glutathione peroxidase